MSAAETPQPPPSPTFNLTWTMEADWPPDTPASVFWGRALQQIGRTMFLNWQGPEFGINPAPDFPPWPQPYPLGRGHPGDTLALQAAVLVGQHDRAFLAEATDRIARERAAATHQREADRAAAAARADTGRPAPPRITRNVHTNPTAGFTVRTDNGTPGERAIYERAREIAAEIDRAGEPYRARAAVVEQRVAEACAMRDLITLYRYSGDGRLYYFDDGWWNVTRQIRAGRFASCKIDRLHAVSPATRSTEPTDFCWLYVERASLATFLASLAPADCAAPSPRPEGTDRDFIFARFQEAVQAQAASGKPLSIRQVAARLALMRLGRGASKAELKSKANSLKTAMYTRGITEVDIPIAQAGNWVPPSETGD